MSEYPPLSALPKLSLAEGTKPDTVNVAEVVDCWLKALQQRLDEKAFTTLSDLFVEECWWRDVIALTWDTTSKNGLQAVGELLRNTSDTGLQLHKAESGSLQPILMDMGGATWVQSGFSFSVKFGQGRGLVRLVNVAPSEWKAWTVSTQLEKLVANETPNRHTEPQTDHLQVLVIGAGHAGLALAAHLQHSGLKYMIVDKVARIGDSWRNRYATLRSHTPKYCDHFPFLPYPDDYPKWAPAARIADWMEHYAQTLNLNVTLNTTVDSVTYNPSTRKYSVLTTTTTNLNLEAGRQQQQQQQQQTLLTTTHVVMATGLFSSTTTVRPSLPGESSFLGTVYHTSQHTSASHIPDLSRKRIVLVGAGTSAHDIAQDFVTCGAASVSLIQRGAIWSVSTGAIEAFQTALWDTARSGLGAAEEADLVAGSFPTAVARTLAVGMTPAMVEFDRGMREGLERAGVALEKGEGGGWSMLDYALIKAGHFYVDQGANDMIIDGRIKIVRSEEGVTGFYEGGVVVGDGRKVDADVVVLATGFERNDVDVARLMGDEVLKKVSQSGRFGGLDDEQERVGWWRPTGVPGFWFMTGSFLWSRQYAGLLALQINAVEKGLNKGHY